MTRSNHKLFRVTVVGLCLSGVAFPATTAHAESRKTGIIAVSKTFAREQPNFLSSSVFELKYQDSVEVLEKNADWSRIKSEKKIGWIPSSALQKEDAVTYERAGRGKKTAPSLYANDTATVGKGFSREYEQLLISNGSKANYEAVNEMERFSFTPEQLQKFSKSVGLKSEVLK